MIATTASTIVSPCEPRNPDGDGGAAGMGATEPGLMALRLGWSRPCPKELCALPTGML